MKRAMDEARNRGMHEMHGPHADMDVHNDPQEGAREEAALQQENAELLATTRGLCPGYDWRKDGEVF